MLIQSQPQPKPVSRSHDRRTQELTQGTYLLAVPTKEEGFVPNSTLDIRPVANALEPTAVKSGYCLGAAGKTGEQNTWNDARHAKTKKEATKKRTRATKHTKTKNALIQERRCLNRMKCTKHGNTLIKRKDKKGEGRWNGIFNLFEYNQHYFDSLFGLGVGTTHQKIRVAHQGRFEIWQIIK